eukprot:5856126-Pyramimonas_sp.AAC.1
MEARKCERRARGGDTSGGDDEDDCDDDDDARLEFGDHEEERVAQFVREHKEGNSNDKADKSDKTDVLAKMFEHATGSPECADLSEFPAE